MEKEKFEFQSGDTVKYPIGSECKLTSIEPPKYVASVCIAEDSNINLTKKPNFVHRFFARVLLGFKYTDI